MVDEAQGRTAGEGMRIVSLIAGALVFYICVVAVSFIIGTLGIPPGSGSYIGAWFVGAGLSSALGVSVARRLAPNVNRVGLIVLMLVPIVLIAIGLFIKADYLARDMVVASICALFGAGVGLYVTFRDLMKSGPAKK